MEYYSALIARCKQEEKEAATKAAARAAVILARMAPRFEKGAIRVFERLAPRFSPALKSVATIEGFDAFHGSFVDAMMDSVKSRDGDKLSYGEAQKPINVFLKMYVDRSSLPDAETASSLRPFLHVPLDSVMIKHFRKNYPEGYQKYIQPEHGKVNALVRARNPDAGKISDRLLSKLTYIYKETYDAWQNWFRAIYPEKPLLLDTIWSLERQTD